MTQNIFAHAAATLTDIGAAFGNKNCSHKTKNAALANGLFQDHHDRAREAYGKPCIRGTRITVQDVLEYLAGGMTEDEILRDFSELTREDIKACLAFAADRERKLFIASA
jgi:uncharacterized protein (DUF433 family)